MIGRIYTVNVLLLDCGSAVNYQEKIGMTYTANFSLNFGPAVQLQEIIGRIYTTKFHYWTVNQRYKNRK